MGMPSLLSIMIFLPVISAFMIMLVRGEKGDEAIVERNVKNLAMLCTVFVLIIGIFMYQSFDPAAAGFQFVEKSEWFSKIGINYHLGVDGISIYFILLSVFLTPICILASWNSVKKRVKEYMIAFLILESFMIGTFSALDSVLFYVFFEGVLIPMFLIIGIWGGPQRVYASYKFFLYTFLGSVLMLAALLALYITTGTTDIPTLIDNPVSFEMQKWLFIAFFASFAVKMPMWPVHTWLPDAHVEAPTAGSVILAGVLLKMGGYGFLRFSLPMLPEASLYYAPFVMWLSVIAIIYASLVALVQEDMKKMIAYSSVAHMGFVTLGIFSFTQQGIDGAVFQMISHGIISAALFLCVGVVYDRLHSREVSKYGGIVKNMPAYATVFMIFVLGSVGLPGTSGFVGEFLTLLGAFQYDIIIATCATTGVVLGAAYMLLLYRRVVFGPVENKKAAAMEDLNIIERVVFAPLVVLVFFLGIYPSVVMTSISPPISRIVSEYEILQKPLEYNQAENMLTPTIEQFAAKKQDIVVEEEILLEEETQEGDDE